MKTMLMTMRLPFLVLSPVNVLLAISLAYYTQHSVNTTYAVLILLAALFAHISVNMLNEYHDFKSGLDLNTKRTPFSGGSGGLPENPGAAPAVLKAGIAALLITTGIGLYFISELGMALLLPGIIGVMVIVLYTGVINRHPWLCLIAPGTGFGLIMVNGAYYVLTGQFSWPVFVISLVPFFLANNLLLLNQYPDLEADRQAGRKHFLIRYGFNASGWVYAASSLLVFVAMVYATVTRFLPAYGLLALIPASLLLYTSSQALRLKQELANDTKVLGLNVAAVILVPVVLSVVLSLDLQF